MSYSIKNIVYWRFILCVFMLLVNDNYAEDAYYSNAGDVFMSSPAYSTDTQLRVLFFKPTSNNLYYAAQAFPFDSALAVPILSPKWQIFDLQPGYHCGFDMGVRGIFNWRGLSGGINWQHFSSSTTAGHTVGENDMVGPFFSIGPDSAPYTRACGRVQFRFNEVNIRSGSYVTMGDYIKAHAFAGVSIAKVKQLTTSSYSDSFATISRTIFTPSVFTGAGPQLGCDFSYDVLKGIYITGQLTGALLMGKSKNYTTYSSEAPGLSKVGNPSPNMQMTCVDNRTQMVPAFSQRLGFAYFYSSCKQCVIKFDCGYEAKIFLNAIQSTDFSSGVVDVTPRPSALGVFARTFARTLGNFSLGGPYISLSAGF